MKNSAMPEKKVTMKLLIDQTTKRVIFAEAGKDLVDFLFHLLSLPVGTVINILSSKSMMGSLGNLYESFQYLNDQYIQPLLEKICLLNPPVTTTTTTQVPLLLLQGDGSTPKAKMFYRCAGGHFEYIASDKKVMCPSPICNSWMSIQVKHIGVQKKEGDAEVGDNGGGGGYVKGLVTYMVMDDLVIEPMSTISGITVLNRFGIKDVSALQEKVVHLGFDEGVALLKASFESKNVLTNVFLAKQTGSQHSNKKSSK